MQRNDDSDDVDMVTFYRTMLEVAMVVLGVAGVLVCVALVLRGI